MSTTPIHGMPGSVEAVPKEALAQARNDLERLKLQEKVEEPVRSGMDDPKIKWRHGSKPDYTLANLSYLKGRSVTHKPGSLEEVVQNLVKTWEMENSHKCDSTQWTTVDHDAYRVSANGGRCFNLKEAAERGNYNCLLHDVDKSLYDASKHTFESSHKLFIDAFDGTFPWEVLKAFAGPPDVAFSWRHWGILKGEYCGRKGDGRTYEMQGFAVVKLDEKLKVQEARVYYDPESFLKAMAGKIPADAINCGKQLLGQVKA